MARILWFKETTRWSRRGIPLRVVWVSPRQLAILFLSVLGGLVASTPLSAATLKLVPVVVFLLAGTIVSFWRVKMLSPEQLILLRLEDAIGSLRALNRKALTSSIGLRLRGRPHQLFQPQRA